MPQITVDDGTDIYYQDVGTGPPIIFLHGGFMNHRVWDRQVAVLEDDYRLVTPDLRGHGRSHAPANGYEPTRLARDLESLVAGLELEGLTVVGWSLGATIVTAYLDVTGREPETVVLTSSGIFQEFADEDDTARGLDVNALLDQHRSNPPVGMEAFIEGLFAEAPTEAERRWLWSIGMGTPLRVVLAVLDIYRTVDYGRLERALSRTDATVGVFHGAHDGVASLKAAEYVADDLVIDGQFVPFDGSGHVPFLEEPELFTEAIRTVAGLETGSD